MSRHFFIVIIDALQPRSFQSKRHTIRIDWRCWSKQIMPNYLVERFIPDAGELMPLELQAIAQQCTRALHGSETQIQWVHSIITADRMVCLYIADDETAVRDHARRSGLPIQRISEVSAIIGPTMDTPGLALNWVDGLNIALIVLPAKGDGPLHRGNDTKSQLIS